MLRPAAAYQGRKSPVARRGWRPALAALELGALAALLLACAALFVVAGARARTLAPIAQGQLDLGPAFYAGLHGSERHAEGYTYLWTTGSALVQLRGAYNAAPAYLAELRLRGANPGGPQPLTLLAGGRPVATVTPEDRFRTYTLLLDASTAGAGAELWLGLQTAPFSPAGDARELGVVLTDVTLMPRAGPARPVAVGAALALAALWLSLRAVRLPPREALALVGLAGLGLAAMPALARPPLLPLPWLGALLLAGVAGAALVARAMAARLGLAALAVLVTLSGVIWPAWLSDDAFISFRYAQNLAQGHGLVYNLGERVEGYTNFLWTVLAALLIALGGDVAVWAHFAGAALGVAVVLLTYALGARLAGPPWGLLAALIVGTSQSLLLYTGRGSGLETGLFTLLILAASERYLRSLQPAAHSPQPLVAAGLLFALAALTRPEGVLVFALTATHQLLWTLTSSTLNRSANRSVNNAAERPWRPSAIGYWLKRFAPAALPAIGYRLSAIGYRLSAIAGAFLAIYLPYFAWRLWYYGDLLPNTFYAKTGGGLSQVLRGAAYAGAFALTLGGPLLAVSLVSWLQSWRTALASWRGYLLPLALIYTAYIVAVGGDHFRGERFFVPLLPWLAILMADGFAALAGLVRTHAGRALSLASAGALALALAVGALGALARTRPIDPLIQGLDESVWIWRDIGWWMADHTPPEASLAAAGAGAVAFYGQRETIDLYGLTDRHIGRLDVEGMGAGVAGHEKRDPAYVLTVRRPTYIPQIWEDYFGGPQALQADYRLIRVTTRTGRELALWERRP